jgi:hypothetical protein
MLAIHWETRRAVLSRRYRSVSTATSGEEELARLLIGGFDGTVDRLTGMLRHPKPDGLAVLLLAHGRLINSMPCEATSSPLKLTTSHPRSLLSMARLNMARSRVRSAICSLMRDRPDVLRSERWLYADQFAFVPGFATCGRADRICEVSPLLQRAIRMRRSIVEPIRRTSACGPTRRGVHIAADRPVPN